mgnify:CR=1 FL=1
MFQIRVIEWSDRKANQDLLENYFRMRHTIYVETRQWSDIERPIAMEIDAFDDPKAIYLIGTGDDGSIMGGTRLVPTLGPHLMSEVFPQLAGNQLPRASNILEWTRFFVAPSLRVPNNPSKAGGIVLCGMIEYALLHDIAGISVVCEAFWRDRFKKLGWQFEQLGPVLHHRHGDIVGLLIHIVPAILAATKEAYGLDLDQSCLKAEAHG